MMQSPKSAPEASRRGFLKQTLALAAAGVAALIPIGAGLRVILSPLRRKADSNANAIKITTLEALPNDGIPRKFSVIAEKTDAWSKYPAAPIGAVYLRRSKDGKIEALNALCPHAGCFIDYSATKDGYLCPCHNSSFSIDGNANPGSPSPRGMDGLQVKIVNDTEVWVVFQNFEAGRADKVPVA
jgi:menaquinol-cytochrome c reductase iron-sulfur subunit